MSKIFAFFHATVSPAIYELIRNIESPYKAFMMLEEKFKSDPYTELQSLRLKISEINAPSIGKYMEVFEKKFAKNCSFGEKQAGIFDI